MPELLGLVLLLFQKAQQEGGPYERLAVHVGLYTGLRPLESNLADVHWSVHRRDLHVADVVFSFCLCPDPHTPLGEGVEDIHACRISRSGHSVVHHQPKSHAVYNVSKSETKY